jgi:hypothetical protein
LIKTFGTLPKEGICLSYKKPLKEFNLSLEEEWRKAGSFENLILKFKET